MKIAYVGFGAYGRHLQSFLHEEYSELIEDEIFFDDSISTEKTFAFNSYLDSRFKNYNFFICIGYHHLEKRREVLTTLIKYNRNTPTFIHKTAYVHPLSKIEKAVYIFPLCNVDFNVSISKGVILHNSVVVSHDSIIGDCTYISPGAIISGNVKIAELCFIGSGTCIANGINIEQNSVIGIGSNITQNIPKFSNVIGNPMCFKSNKISLI